MTPPTATKSATEREVVYAAAKRHGVPGWLLWGIYGAENSWNPHNGTQFGLIESSYPQLNGGKGRTVKNHSNLAESADVAAELLANLKQEHGSWGGAVLAYSGGEYSISHPRQLSSQNTSQGATVPVSFLGELGGLFGGSVLGPNIPTPAEGGGGAPGALGNAEELGERAGSLGSSLLGPLTTIGEVFKGIGELFFTPEGWLRLGKMIGGAILFLWGIDILVKNAGAQPQGISTARKVVDTVAAIK